MKQKCGVIYILTNPSFPEYVKIGYADDVTAWSKGGSTEIDNCQMLCQTHNRAKGNR